MTFHVKDNLRTKQMVRLKSIATLFCLRVFCFSRTRDLKQCFGNKKTSGGKHLARFLLG